MEEFNAKISTQGHLSCTLMRADGTHRDIFLGDDTRKWSIQELAKKLREPMSFWKRMYDRLKSSNALPLGMTFGAFLYAMHHHDTAGLSLALVTTAGVNILAADFVSGATTHIAAFNYHDSGTGTTAAVIADTALQTSAAMTRAPGTQSTPASGQYKTVGTQSYTGAFAITEWGLFSAASTGTMWDHRIFAAVNVANGDQIGWQYTLTVNAGGS